MSEARPLRLNTGRIRDQWHTMTRTGLSPRLGQHIAEPYVEIHPDDAAQAGIAHDGFARVATDLGQCVLKVVVTERQQRGMLFAPIHWSESNSSSARVGALVAPFTDPFSGQPENKATPAAIEAAAVKLGETSQKMGQAMYEAAAAAAAAAGDGAETGGGDSSDEGDDDVVDAEIVDDEGK